MAQINLFSGRDLIYNTHSVIRLLSAIIIIQFEYEYIIPFFIDTLIYQIYVSNIYI